MADPVNHDEAWSLAHYRREHSNLARCYIEAMTLLLNMVSDQNGDIHLDTAKGIVNQIGRGERPSNTGGT